MRVPGMLHFGIYDPEIFRWLKKNIVLFFKLIENDIHIIFLSALTEISCLVE